MKKNACGDVFFQIDTERSPAHKGLHILAGALCVIFALWVWMLNPIPQIHGDQMNIVTMVLTTKHPDNFARDPVYTGKVAKPYPLFPRLITAGFIKRFGIIGGHRMIQLPLSIAYLFVMYGVLYYLTRSVPGAVLVTLASVIWRWSVGETYWGLDRMQAVQPRSFALVLMPLLFVLFWKLRRNWWLLVPFFVAGLLFNINPPSALFFGGLSWLSLLLVILYNHNRIPRLRDRLLRLLGGGAAFIAGTLPYLFVNITARNDTTVELSGQALQEHMDALQYLYRLMAYLPLSTSTLTKVLLVGFSALVFLATIAWCLRKERRNMFDSWLVCFFLLAFVCPVIAQYAMQAICAQFKIMPVFLDCMRAQKTAYLPLYIYIAWLLAELLSRLNLRERSVLIVVTAMIVVIMPVFGKDSRDPWGQWRYNAGQMKTLLGGEKIEIAGWHNRILDISSWARQKTPKDSLFLFAHHFMDPFRVYAQRSIVNSRGSGCIAYYRGPKAVTIWAKYQQEMEWIIATRNVPRLLRFADYTKADYIIVPNAFPEVTGWPVVMRDRFWTVYKRP